MRVYMNRILLSKCEISIKNYQKIKRINKGGFGIVYKVEKKETGELFAAKVIDCNDNEEKCNEVINREVSIMIYANHPTLIKFFGYSKYDFQGEHNITILMELASNGSLRDVLKTIQESDGPKDYTNTSRQIILVGICRGMKYLHDRNIIHRDLKAENILLDDDFHPHITDFGLSKIYEIGHSCSQTKFCGTLSYEAPEILRKKQYNGKVDVYAFAILMFEVLTDTVPYPELFKEEITDYEFKNKVVNENYRPRFKVPVKNSLKKLIEKCWSEDPEERPNFDEIFYKLSNKSNEKEEDYLLDDVDMDEFNLYVDDVSDATDSTEKFVNKVSIIEKENQQLKNEIKKLKLENKQQKDTIELIEEEKKQLEEENKQLKIEIDKIREELKQAMSEKNEIKIKSKRNKNEPVMINKSEIIQFNDHFNHSKVIIAAGRNDYSQFGRLNNHKSHSDINHPQILPFDPSSLLSFSTYFEHSVLVTKSGSLQGSGHNYDGRISASLKKSNLTQFTEFFINDNNGNQLTPVSAVCSDCGTLYMLSKGNGRRMQLAYCDWQINGGNPVFIDIGNEEPIALFGGCFHNAAISNKGEIIFINRHPIKKSPKSRISPVSLPFAEKAVSVACCLNLVVVLSSNGRVFESPVTERSSCILRFSAVSELTGQKIVCVSGTKDHCFAVNREGKVFGRGNNEYGQLGLGKSVSSAMAFTEITSLGRYKIRAAYAGYHHSLFETKEGKILSCGPNNFGQLLLRNGPNGNVYFPSETTITEGATFCIAGYISAVFIGCEPPPNTPNRKILFK